MATYSKASGAPQHTLAGQQAKGRLFRQLRPSALVILDALRLTLCMLAGCLSGLAAFGVYYASIVIDEPSSLLLFFQEPTNRYLYLSLFGGLIFANITFVIQGRSTIGRNGDFLRNVAISWMLSLLIVICILFLLKTGSEFSRGLVIVWTFLGLPFVLAARVLEQRIARFLAKAGFTQRRVAIVGATAQAEQLAARLRTPDLSGGIDVVGIFHESDSWPVDVDSDLPIVGHLDDLKQLCRRDMLDAVILALPGDDPKRIRAAANALHALPADLVLGPDLAQLELRTNAISKLGPLSVVSLSKVPMQDWWGVAKWLEDMILSLLALFLLAPLFMIIALLIKLDSPGPVLFRQQRFGFNSREFGVLKFRTMYHALGDADGAVATRRQDRRVTPVGRILRRTSLDELPQLINVLRGEMSIVGPRAHPVKMRLGDRLIHDEVQDYAARHRVKPGITGLAQVNGNRGEIQSLAKAEQRIRFDLHYIDNWSVWLDIEIVIRTVLRLPFDRSAY